MIPKKAIDIMDRDYKPSLEMRTVSVKQNNDENDLARLGKAPVLKVSSLSVVYLWLASLSDTSRSEDLASCPFWVSAVLYSSHGKAFSCRI